MRPPLKTPLPKNELKNYRPVSNLSFISKKVVVNWLQAHIQHNHLSNPLKCPYRKHYSTESALQKLHSDIIISIYKGEVTALTLLDLSAVFDTITHATLTNILSDCYGISGQAQIRFSSYLQNRYQSVKIKDTMSDKVTISCGVLSAPFNAFKAKESLEKLNASKTEFLIGTKIKREKLLNNIPCLILGQDTNPSARKAR